MRRQVNATAAARFIVLVLAGVLLVSGCGRERPGPIRTVALSMKNYAFNGRNPTLDVEPGERIHFIVTNDEDSRVLHNFRIVGMDIPCGPPMLPGERRDLMVTMPKSGEFAYTCCTHPGMGGKLVVKGR